MIKKIFAKAGVTFDKVKSAPYRLKALKLENMVYWITFVSVLAAVFVCSGAYVWNIIKLLQFVEGPIGMLIGRVIGIFVFPIGVIMGFF